jgi:hypothetical protein
MTLEKTLLQKVPDWRPTPQERATLAVVADDGMWTARLTADRCEALSAALWELRLDRLADSVALTPEQLDHWAKAVVALPALIDPLAVVEIDRTNGRAQLRSATPTERAGRITYFEILLSKHGQVDVRRYQAGRSEREQIVFVMTHENLARLAGYLTEAVDGLKLPVAR